MSKTFKRTFPVPLSVEDKAKKADEFASVQADIEKVEADKKAFDSACREKLEILYGKHSDLARVVRSGEEERRVECQWLPHPDRPMMQLHRLDRAETDPDRIVEERPMTEEEAQAKLSDKWDIFAEKLNAEPAEEESPPKRPAALPSCPALLGGSDEIYNVCGKPGAKRVGGYCEEHKGRMKQGDVRARDVTARKKRDQHVAELAAEAGKEVPVAEEESGESGGGVNVNVHDLANDVSRCIDCGEAPCACEERAGDAA